MNIVRRNSQTTSPTCGRRFGNTCDDREFRSRNTRPIVTEKTSLNHLTAKCVWPWVVLMSKSIAVFGAGPGLGQAVARRYAREGYAVTLVARNSEPLDRLAKDLTGAGATAHVITADL